MTHTVDHVELRPGAYADSVALLQVSKDLATVPGVVAAQVAMATELNLDVIRSMGFTIDESSPNDMIVALRVESEDVIAPALAALDKALEDTRRQSSSSDEVSVPSRTSLSAMNRTGAGLALISTPGASAAVEAMDALDAGHGVMIFSDNVPLD